MKLTYEESFRRHAESLREHYRAEWIAYHKAAAQQLKRTLWRLVKEHEEETARLERGLSA